MENHITKYPKKNRKKGNLYSFCREKGFRCKSGMPLRKNSRVFYKYVSTVPNFSRLLYSRRPGRKKGGKEENRSCVAGM